MVSPHGKDRILLCRYLEFQLNLWSKVTASKMHTNYMYVDENSTY